MLHTISARAVLELSTSAKRLAKEVEVHLLWWRIGSCQSLSYSWTFIVHSCTGHHFRDRKLKLHNDEAHQLRRKYSLDAINAYPQSRRLDSTLARGTTRQEPRLRCPNKTGSEDAAAAVSRLRTIGTTTIGSPWKSQRSAGNRSVLSKLLMTPDKLWWSVHAHFFPDRPSSSPLSRVSITAHQVPVNCIQAARIHRPASCSHPCSAYLQLLALLYL